MPGRNFVSGSSYKYGFNGKEKDDEIKGNGNSYDFGARMYDSRLGRWLAVDPLAVKYPNLSPYNFCANNPILFVDPDGKKIDWFGSRGIFKVRRDLFKTAAGRQTWKEMKESPTLITVINTDKVLVNRNANNSLTPMEGNTDNHNYIRGERHGKYARSYFETATSTISMGTFMLMNEVAKEYGAKSWGDLTPEQKKAGMESHLKGRKDVIDQEGKKVDTEIVTVKINTSHTGFKDAEPLEGETTEEYNARVSGHEITHGVTGAKNINLSKAKFNSNNQPIIEGTDYNDRQEKDGYKREGEIIEQQNQNRKKDD